MPGGDHARKAAVGVCAVIPVHDEAASIAGVVREVMRFVGEVLVFDDGSSDGSARLAEAAGARVLGWPRRRGKGAAVRAALEDVFERQDFEAAVVLDGDGQHVPAEIPRFLAAYEAGADLVLGDRSGGFSRMPLPRRLANTAMTALLRPWAGRHLRDSQCGFRLFASGFHRALHTARNHFDAESEVLIEAHRLGARVVQVPVSVVYGSERSKIRVLPDTWRFLGLLARAAFSPPPATPPLSGTLASSPGGRCPV